MQTSFYSPCSSGAAQLPSWLCYNKPMLFLLMWLLSLPKKILGWISILNYQKSIWNGAMLFFFSQRLNSYLLSLQQGWQWGCVVLSCTHASSSSGVPAWAATTASLWGCHEDGVRGDQPPGSSIVTCTSLHSSGDRGQPHSAHLQIRSC